MVKQNFDTQDKPTSLFLYTGGCKFLTAWSTHHCCWHYNRTVPTRWRPAGHKRRGSQLHPCKAVSLSAPPAEHGPSMHQPAPFSKAYAPSTAFTNESWARGLRFEEENDSSEKHKGSKGTGWDWRSPLWPSTSQKGKPVVGGGRPNDLV